MSTATTTPATKLRTILVNDLGRDALVFTRYGLALVDSAAAAARPAEIAAWLDAAANGTEATR